jgi:hypothetical protein
MSGAGVFAAGGATCSGGADIATGGASGSLYAQNTA